MKIIKQLSQENKKMETELNNGILNLKEKKLVVDDTLSKEIRMEYGKNYITIILIIQLVIMNRDNVTFLIGQYNNAKKCNQWKILFKSEKESQQEIIGGDRFASNYGQLIYQGIQRNRKKDQKWDIKNRDKSSEFVAIGGGLYDSEGRKNEQWIELNPNFSLYLIFQLQIIRHRFVIRVYMKMEKKMVNGKFFQSWIKMKDSQEKDHSQVRYKGKYQKSKKQDNRYCQRLKQQWVMEIMMEMERRLANGRNYMINLKI
ncbi:unnamed protein product [Paramecium pentaurelia]|uniref:Uncharacterized protein n=1 Tax=Paramecium pentaurelia TaxID=43138 RepID=A0A8S1U606_9CILI|nr:unnamed protein product [Paramecium pentaurelia]